MALNRIQTRGVLESLPDVLDELDCACYEVMRMATWTPNGSCEREYLLTVEESLAKIKADLVEKFR